jgi:hypothetical protein
MVIDNFISISLYTGRSISFPASRYRLNQLGMTQGYWLTAFGGYQRWAATRRDGRASFDGYRRRTATWWLLLAFVWQWREEEEVPIVVCVVNTPWWDYKWVCSHPNNWTKVAPEMLNSLWATKRNAQVSFYIALCDTGPPAHASKEPKKSCRLPIAPLVFLVVTCRGGSKYAWGCIGQP